MSLPHALVGLNQSCARNRVERDFSRPGRLHFVYRPGCDGLPEVFLLVPR